MILTATTSSSFDLDPFLIMSEKDELFDGHGSDETFFRSPTAGYASMLSSASQAVQTGDTSSMPLPVQPVRSLADERLMMADTSRAASASSDLSTQRSSTVSSPSSPKRSINNVKLPFPWKLFQLLEDIESQGLQHIVSWMPSGKCFRVHEAAAFTAHIMPRYFRMSKFQSFTRQRE